jgi:hypothetical protein
VKEGWILFRPPFLTFGEDNRISAAADITMALSTHFLVTFDVLWQRIDSALRKSRRDFLGVSEIACRDHSIASGD